MAEDKTTKKNAEIPNILLELKLTDPKKSLDLSTRKKLEEFLNTPFDFANATDQELDYYKKALDFYKLANTGISKKEKLSEDIYNYVSELNNSNDPLNVGNKLTEEQVKTVANTSADRLLNNSFNRNDIFNLLDSYTGKRGWNSTIGWRIQNTFQPKLAEYVDSGTYNDSLSQSEKSLTDVLSGRQALAADQAYLQDYLATAPQQLAKTREEFFKGQRKSAIDYLNQYVIPEQITPIEQTGLATDREIAKMISNLYAGVNTNLQNQEVQQAVEDYNFFADAAYKSKLQDLVSSRGNLRAQTQADFQTAQTKQQQGFLKSQQDIQNKFELDVFQRENERALQQYQSKLNQQRANQDKANQANLFSNIGGTVAGVGLAAATKGAFSGAA